MSTDRRVTAARSVHPVPREGDAIEICHSTTWQRGTVERVTMVDGHAMIAAEVDGGGPRVTSWWDSEYFRPLVAGVTS